ncbi:hypothetical protein [Lysinibacillus xylanilyticus]|uniref:hypothetical protein n=1 Tax=Lysinibacillus xylanilyticus TaxID=582475 RepID=UPI0038173B35
MCITQENKNNPWILCESGALAKGLTSSRVCTSFIDLKPSDIKDPLAQFNHTMPNKDNVRGLVRTLNSTLPENNLPEKILEQVFETYWPQFEEKFNDILATTSQPEIVETRTDDDILSELLYITRGMDRRIRDIEFKNENNNEKDKRIVAVPPIQREIRRMIVEDIPEDIIFKNIRDNFKV